MIESSVTVSVHCTNYIQYIQLYSIYKLFLQVARRQLQTFPFSHHGSLKPSEMQTDSVKQCIGMVTIKMERFEIYIYISTEVKSAKQELL